MKLTKSLQQLGFVLLTLVLFVCAWQSIVWIWKIPPFILPSPSQVLQAAIKERETLLKATATTGLTALTALKCSMLFGSLIAILFSLSSILRKSLYPYAVFLQTVPIVAIAPLLIVWSGPNRRTVVLVAMIVSLFPIISNVTAGLITVDANLRDLFRLSGATRFQTLTKLSIPSAIGNLILGSRVSAGLSVIGTIIGEFYVGIVPNSWSGLGTIITAWNTNLRTAELIAAVITSTLVGLCMLGWVNLLSKTILKRWTSNVGFESGA